MLNLPAHHFFTVEPVESVENPSLNPCFIDKTSQTPLANSPTDMPRIACGNVTKKDLSSYFSTLSTKIKTNSVENQKTSNTLKINNLRHFPQIPHDPHEKTDDPAKKRDFKLILDWLQIVIEEGHIEPAQPSVGRIVGWPRRAFSTNSLFVDFDWWCRKQGLLEWEVAPKRQFYALADELFYREGDTYNFAPLDICRKIFAALRRKYAP